LQGASSCASAQSVAAGGGAALTDHPERQEIANTALPLASSRPVMPLVVWSAEDASQMAQRPRAWDAGREEEDRRSGHEAAIAVFSGAAPGRSPPNWPGASSMSMRSTGHLR